ncbi:hypothetical protein ACQKPE_00815 [Pseudomonas sp. NPDC089554]|uniref:hypothetical protein n=1 Tax=Pseudomonas sp. NPDC089554 TaxID=3390653 RepID=UPI003CFFC707
MIHVPRGPAPASLSGTTSAGHKETEAAIDKVVKAPNRIPVPPYNYKAYKGADVVDALRTLFHKKCAYCEFNYAAGGPEDVEHFRPKGAVVIDEKMVKPGYYWLAADWDNLLPSCMDCNRKRTKVFDDKSVGMSGKANLFPVDDEAMRWRDHAQPNTEQALLLDPCVDQPLEHLEFLPQGGVRALSSKGDASIKVYGLLREDLVIARALKETRVKAAIESALELTELMQLESDPKLKTRLRALAAKQLAEAKSHLEPREPYLAVARIVFNSYGLKP